jgi:hypothetical protein
MYRAALKNTFSCPPEKKFELLFVLQLPGHCHGETRAELGDRFSQR